MKLTSVNKNVTKLWRHWLIDRCCRSHSTVASQLLWTTLHRAAPVFAWDANSCVAWADPVSILATYAANGVCRSISTDRVFLFCFLLQCGHFAYTEVVFTEECSDKGLPRTTLFVCLFMNYFHHWRQQVLLRESQEFFLGGGLRAWNYFRTKLEDC